METSVNNKCRAFTSLEQSKKLAEILPIESADMWWSRCTITDFGDGILKVSYAVEPCNISQFRNTKEDIPCWSLAALISVLPNYQLQTQDDGIGVLCSCNGKFNIVTADNPIDACYEMILKLHELKML